METLETRFNNVLCEDEIINVFSFLEPIDYYNATLVCKYWNRILSSQKMSRYNKETVKRKKLEYLMDKGIQIFDNRWNNLCTIFFILGVSLCDTWIHDVALMGLAYFSFILFNDRLYNLLSLHLQSKCQVLDSSVFLTGTIFDLIISLIILTTLRSIMLRFIEYLLNAKKLVYPKNSSLNSALKIFKRRLFFTPTRYFYFERGPKNILVFPLWNGLKSLTIILDVWWYLRYFNNSDPELLLPNPLFVLNKMIITLLLLTNILPKSFYITLSICLQVAFSATQIILDTIHIDIGFENSNYAANLIISMTTLFYYIFWHTPTLDNDAQDIDNELNDNFMVYYFYVPIYASCLIQFFSYWILVVELQTAYMTSFLMGLFFYLSFIYYTPLNLEKLGIFARTIFTTAILCLCLNFANPGLHVLF